MNITYILDNTNDYSTDQEILLSLKHPDFLKFYNQKKKESLHIDIKTDCDFFNKKDLPLVLVNRKIFKKNSLLSIKELENILDVGISLQFDDQ